MRRRPGHEPNLPTNNAATKKAFIATLWAESEDGPGLGPTEEEATPCSRADRTKKDQSFFTCGRRPAGLLATLVVVVVVVVVGGGGNNFYTCALLEPMYGLDQIKSRTPYFYYFSSFYFKSPCMV